MSRRIKAAKADKPANASPAPAPRALEPTRSSRATTLAAVSLVILSLVAYVPLLDAGFIWDDDDYVTQNETLRTSNGLYRIWFVPRSIPQYYPLVHSTFWIEYQLWGLQPTGYHVVNVLLHGLSSVLLWRLLARLNVPGAYFAAAIFAVHPVMTESVAWITERKNVLSLVLALGSLLCYFRFESPEPPMSPSRSRDWRFYATSLVLFLAALFSKTVVCTLPAVIVVIQWWKRGEIRWGSLRPLAPFFAVGISLGLTTAWLEKHHVGAQGIEWSLTPLDRIVLAGRIVWFYAAKLVWPEPLIFFYPRWNIDASQAWQFLFPVAALAVIVALWFARNVIGRGPLAALLIFVGVLFPALGFIDVYPFRYSFVADHFQYHASIALIALLAATTTLVMKKLGPTVSVPAKVAAALLLLVLAGLTYRQSQAYFDLETLYLDTLAKNSNAWGASANLSEHYLSAGRYDDALSVARQSVAASPHVADVHNSLGAVLLWTANKLGPKPGQYEEAIDHFRESLRIQPQYPKALFNLSTALSVLGRHAEAIPYFTQALELDPNDVDVLVGLAKSQVVVGQPDRAYPLLQTALQLAPNHAAALHGLGLVQDQNGQRDKAISYYQAALRVEDEFVDAHFDLASALLAKKDYTSARDHYLRVIERQPWNVRARNNLGVVFLNMEQKALAIEQFSEAVRIAPDYEQARKNLDRAQHLETPRP
jgi:protein O-mannosyl-transferase